MHLAPLRNHWFTIADGSRVEFPYGEARIRIDDDVRTCPVIFGPEDDALLAATTLEGFNLMADPANKRLIPVDVLPLGWGGKR